MRAIVAVTALLAACTPQYLVDTGDTADDGNVPYQEPTGIVDPDDSGEGHRQGSVVLVHTTTPSGATSTSLRAMFANDLSGLVDAPECLLDPDGACLTALPADDDGFIDLSGVGPDPATIDWVDAGATVTLGSFVAPAVSDGLTSTLYYSADFTETWPSGQPVGLAIAGDFGAYAGSADISVPKIPNITAPSDGEPIVLSPGMTIPIRWEPGDSGIFYLRVTSDRVDRLFALVDDGAYDLDPDVLGLASGGVTFRAGRWEHATVSVDEADEIQIWARAESRITTRVVDPTAYTALTLPDTCAGAIKTGALATGTYAYAVDVGGSSPTLDPGAGSCLAYGAPGADALIPVDVLAGHTLVVEYQAIDGDGAVYLLSDCEDASTCVQGAHGTGTERIIYPNESGALESMYLVVDGYGPTSAGLLDIQLGNLTTLPHADTCTEIGGIPDASATTSRISMADLTDSAATGCHAGLSGPEFSVPLTIPGGSDVQIDVRSDTADLALSLVTDCAAPECLVAANDGLYEESLHYVNGTWNAMPAVLVVEAIDGDPGNVLVDIQFTSHTPLTMKDTCPETTKASALFDGDYAGDLTGYDNISDPGLGGCSGANAIGADGALPLTVPSGDLLVATMQADGAILYAVTECSDESSCVDGRAATTAGPARVAWRNEADEIAELVLFADSQGEDSTFLLDVERSTPTVIEPADACAGADGLELLVTGTYYGDSSDWTDHLDPGPEGCAPTASGPDGFLPVELPTGQTLTVTYEQLHEDGAIYLVSDCDDARTCLAGRNVPGRATADTLVYTNTAKDTAQLYLVIDAYHFGGPFTLDVAID